MAPLKPIGYDDVSRRSLFVVRTSTWSDIEFVLPPDVPMYVCLLVADASCVPAATITSVGRRLLLQGCAYFCCWGPDCERLHDRIDDAIGDVAEGSPIAMTTWHDKESFASALWFSLYVAFPDDAYLEFCRGLVVICINAPDEAAVAERAFGDVREFSRLLLSSEPG